MKEYKSHLNSKVLFIMSFKPIYNKLELNCFTKRTHSEIDLRNHYQ